MKKTIFALLAVPFFFVACDNCKNHGDEKTSVDTAKTVETCEWNHIVNWFEIPVTDFNRALTFYETILGIKMQVYTDTTDKEYGPYSMGFFSNPEKADIVSGAIVKSNVCKPATEGGVTIYLNANPDLSVVLGRIEAAGGKVTMPKTPIGENHEHGFMAMFIDTEGNHMALHSGN